MCMLAPGDSASAAHAAQHCMTMHMMIYFLGCRASYVDQKSSIIQSQTRIETG